MFKATIIGGTGYGGAELVRQLIQHPEVELCHVVSIDEVGKNLGEVHLNLQGLTDLTFENIPPEEAAKGMDVVLLGLPHTVSSKVAPKLFESGAKVIDMSGDFRLRDLEAYETRYNVKHPHPELLGSFVYGLPELDFEAVKAATRIAVPGCFATCISLGLLPLAKAGLLTQSVKTVAATGSSGSGAYAKAGTHHPLRANNLRAYLPMRHRHQPEIKQALRDAGAPADFDLKMVPVSAPLVRGILATSFATVPAEWDQAKIEALYQEYYGQRHFVKVVTHRLPEVVGIAGTNFAEVGVSVSEPEGGTRDVAAFSTLDNLVKGGAGQAIQNMNIALGLPENAGILGDVGIWP